ncbi:IS982 family transposase, partial [Ornithobacterium rhinotracheale]
MSNLEASYNFILNKLIEFSGTENFYFKPVKTILSVLEVIWFFFFAVFKSFDSEYLLF